MMEKINELGEEYGKRANIDKSKDVRVSKRMGQVKIVVEGGGS